MSLLINFRKNKTLKFGPSDVRNGNLKSVLYCKAEEKGLGYDFVNSLHMDRIQLFYSYTSIDEVNVYLYTKA